MKHNTKWKTWLCVATMMGMTTLMTPVASVYAEDNTISSDDSNEEGSNAETWTAKKEWAYKVIDGHLYKRLYNYSTGRWETDWILIE